MIFEISGSELLLSLSGIVCLIAGVITVMRKRSSAKTKTPALQKSGMNAFRWRSPLLGFGLMTALAVMILAFSWTTYGPGKMAGQLPFELEDILVKIPPTVQRPPAPPPPPAPPSIKEVPDDLSLEQTVFENYDISAFDEVVPRPFETKAPVFNIPPPPMPDEPEAPFIIVEESPTFKGCESVPVKKEREQCALENLLKFIYQRIKYPTLAAENGITGTAVIRFIVEKDGSISHAEVVRDPGGGCGAEALRVVQLMPNWNPGKQQGRPVRVQFTLPVQYRLD